MHFHIYRAMLGRVLWHLGYPDRALHMVRQAIAAADESGHPFTRTDVFQWAAVLHQLRRERFADSQIPLAPRAPSIHGPWLPSAPRPRVRSW
jgi:hypothetical protein